MASPFIATAQAADRQELDLLQQSIRARKGILACGDEYAAAVTAGGRVLFAGSNAYGQEQATAWQDILAVCGSRDYLLGLTGDGSVHFAGRDTHGIRAGVAHWSRVDMVACSTTHAAALLIGGRVLCAGELSDRCTDTSEWSDVRDICCGRDFTLGLTAAGEVLIAGGSYALREHIATWGTVVGLFSDVQGNAAYAVLGAEMEQSGFCGSIERLYPCADSRGTTPHREPHRCGSGRCRVCFTGSRGIRTAGARPPGERNIAGNTHAAQVPVRRNARRGGHRLERFVRLDTVVRTV